MATTLEHLIAARDGAAQRLRAAMTNPTAEGYPPNAVSAPNVVDHQGLVRNLLDVIKELDEQILEETIRSDGAFEVTSEMSA